MQWRDNTTLPSRGAFGPPPARVGLAGYRIGSGQSAGRLRAAAKPSLRSYGSSPLQARRESSLRRVANVLDGPRQAVAHALNAARAIPTPYWHGYGYTAAGG